MTFDSFFCAVFTLINFGVCLITLCAVKPLTVSLTEVCRQQREMAERLSEVDGDEWKDGGDDQ